jgi:hypothetical protein
LPQTCTLHAQFLPFYQICMPSGRRSGPSLRVFKQRGWKPRRCWPAARLIGSEVPASIESAAALDRDGRVAKRKRSTLQVVRVTCLAARVGRDAAALALGGRVHSSQGACAAEPGWSASSSASSAPSACQTRVVRGLLLLLTTTVDAPGEQSTSVCLRVREHLSLVLLRCKNPLTLARVN